MKAAVNLAMASEGAINYKDIMNMNYFELSTVVELVEDIIEERIRAMKRHG